MGSSLPAQVREAEATLAAHARGERAVTPAELQHAQMVLAVAAPQGTLAPMPCRTAGWALSAAPVVAFIVSNAARHPTSLPRIVLGH